MQRLISAEKGEAVSEVPDAPPPFHHDIDHVIHTWLERRLHRIYPEEGGLLNQDAELMSDWSSLDILYVRTEKGATSSFSVPDNAQNWQSTLGD